MNNPYVMILKPFPGLLADTKYDYFILFKNMDKLDLLWSEIECSLMIWPSITLKSNISLDIFHKQTLLCTHRAH